MSGDLSVRYSTPENSGRHYTIMTWGEQFTRQLGEYCKRENVKKKTPKNMSEQQMQGARNCKIQEAAQDS